MPDTGITSIGKYRILDLVGEGAMGVVYRALDSVLNRPVAIKVMSDAIARQEDLRDRFLREAQAAGSLQHPNVITIYDFGEVEGHLYIAMEFIEGVDLATLLARREPLTLAAKLDLAIDVLNGLAYAHRRGVVHRDIKPANIRVTEEGRAKIMDFGVAHLTSSNMTRTGTMMGTPSYMAPEQVTGGRVTPAADIFSVGAVLYELLTGAQPFEGPTLHAILYKITSEDPPDMQKLLPGLPAALDRVVKRALAKDVADRYANALDMANDLTAVRATLGGGAQSGTLSLRASVASAEAARAAAQVDASRTRSSLVAAMGGGALAAVAALLMLWVVLAPHRVSRDAAGSPASPDSAGVAGRASRESSAAIVTGRGGSGEAGGAIPPRTGSLDAKEPASLSPPPAPPAPETPRPTSAAARETREARETRPRTSPTGAAAGAAAASRNASPPRPAATEPAPSRAPAVSAAAPVTPPPAVSAPSAQPVAPSPPPRETAAPTNPTAEVTAAVAAYARAIESRDVAEVRRAYRGITPAQESGFAQFFEAARSLRATFSVSDVSVAGTSAEARVTGSYDYVAADGKPQHQPVTFHATLRNESGTWRLMGVR